MKCYYNTVENNERRLWSAAGLNFLLMFTQIVGGIVSGSFSLVANALHHFRHSCFMLIVAIAARTSRKPPEQLKTLGYKRAETVAALVTLTVLIVLGFCLFSIGITRLHTPQDIAGWTMLEFAGLALAFDLLVVVITYALLEPEKKSGGAFLHTFKYSLASVGVIITSLFVLFFNWLWLDAVLTLAIAGYVLWRGFTEIPKAIHLVMEGAPEGMNLKELTSAIEAEKGVVNVYHVHVWQLSEHQNALDAHVVLSESANVADLKARLKRMLRDNYDIEHSTLEFESTVSN